MIDARRLAPLPKGAILINVARGPLVVTEISSPRSNRVIWRRRGRCHRPRTAAAQPAVGSAQRDHHAARGRSVRDRIDDMTNFFCDNLRRYLSGEPFANLVDKRLGFPLPEPAPRYRGACRTIRHPARHMANSRVRRFAGIGTEN